MAFTNSWLRADYIVMQKPAPGCRRHSAVLRPPCPFILSKAYRASHFIHATHVEGGDNGAHTSASHHWHWDATSTEFYIPILPLLLFFVLFWFSSPFHPTGRCPNLVTHAQTATKVVGLHVCGRLVWNFGAKEVEGGPCMSKQHRGQLVIKN